MTWWTILRTCRELAGFPGARLNFAENLLLHQDEREALVTWNERGPPRQLHFAYEQLHDQVARIAQSFRRLGVGPRDRVGGFLPNLPETAERFRIMLAADSRNVRVALCYLRELGGNVRVLPQARVSQFQAPRFSSILRAIPVSAVRTTARSRQPLQGGSVRLTIVPRHRKEFDLAGNGVRALREQNP